MFSFNKNDINDDENDDGNFNVIVSGSDDHTLRIFCDKNVEVEYKNGLENIEENDDIYDIEMEDMSIFVINENDNNNNNENNNNLMNVDSEHSRENEDDEDNEIF